MVDNTRQYIINRIKSKKRTIDEFNWEKLTCPPLYTLLSPEDIAQLDYIAGSIKLASKPKEKFKMIDDIMRRRGFVKFVAGTNRITYRPIEDKSFLIKIAFDNAGKSDAPRELYNQQFLKPFVTKVFEVSPGGAVCTIERVVPITNREEFMSIAPDVFVLINNWLIGEFVMDDIGSEKFMNYGVRTGFGPVLLDYPYMHKVDYNKLFCSLKDKTGTTLSGTCEGEIDYDDGYNRLVCKKCGAEYKAVDLARAIDEDKVIIKRRKGDEEAMELKINISGGSKNINNEIKVGGEEQKFAKAMPSKPIKEMEKPQQDNNVAVNGVGDKLIINTSDPEIDKKEEKEPVKAVGAVEVKEKKQLESPIIVHEKDDPRLKAIAEEADKKIAEYCESKNDGDFIESTFGKVFDILEAKKDELDSMSDENKQSIREFIFSMISLLGIDEIGKILESIIREYTEINTAFDGICVAKKDEYEDMTDDNLIISLSPALVLDVNTRVELLEGNNSIDIAIPINTIANKLSGEGIELSSIAEDGKYNGFVTFAAKSINKKDIEQNVNSSRILALINKDGNYLTDIDNNIIAVEVVDGKNVGAVSIVSSGWLKEIQKIADIKDSEEKENEMKQIPVGAAPQYEDVSAETKEE